MAILKSDSSWFNRKSVLLIAVIVLALVLLWFALSPNQAAGKLPNSMPSKDSTSLATFQYPMIYVEAGAFTMGSPIGEFKRQQDECQHVVQVGAFSIGQYEVTQGQWRFVMGSNPSENAGCDNCPVASVSWDQVQLFIKALNKLGKDSIIYRLPTEAEWEYAARGGKIGARKPKLYAGNNELDSIAWYRANSDLKSHPVGQKLPNELGLYDMSGNVWEWCQDNYKAYPGCKAINEEGLYPILRGGSWYGGPPYCRVAFRYYNGAEYGHSFVGFRLAADKASDISPR